MKIIVAIASALTVWSGSAAAVYNFQGSDTLAGVMTDAIIASGMNSEIAYVGGGSGKGEEALVKNEQGIAPMSREMKPEAIEQGGKNGLTFKQNVIALDGLGIFVNGQNSVAGLSLEVIKSIYTCQLTDWRDVPGANLSGRINAVRRNDKSGTTDTFKHLVGVSKFGDCVQVMEETVDIAEKTAKDSHAIGYSGHTALRETNRAVGVSRTAGEAFVQLNVNTVRSFAYPLSRKLFVYEVSGAAKPNATEAKLLRKLKDRSFLDPIIQDNEFYTID